MKKRVGMYAWGGPGTIRLLQTKYHSPRIDERSFMTLYEQRYWHKAQYLFGVTDAWLTYSWGFSDEHEQQDYEFVLSRLKNFQKLGIKTHAYVQGFNAVTEDFKDQDLFCRDPWGHYLPYIKGRRMTCPNNPQARELLLRRVKQAAQEKFDGIYVDNVVFGLPPFFVSQNFVPFFGCACKFCREKFEREFGYPQPLEGFDSKTLKDYLRFRAKSAEEVIAAAADIARQHHKEFGINLYDPFLHTPELYFGYNLAGLEKYLSYYLIENNFHPARLPEGNSHLADFIKKGKKPVFIVSYKKGIGFEEEFWQKDLDVMFSESEQLGYSPCLKATEFTTFDIWHTLKLEEYVRPRKVNLATQNVQYLPEKLLPAPAWKINCVRLMQPFAPLLLTAVFENRLLNFLVRKTGLFQKQLWSIKVHEID